jgi:L-arabinokinase
LELPFSGGFDVFPSRAPIPLVARRPTRSRRETRAHFAIPDDRPAVLLSFGGYGLPSLDLGCLDCLGDWTIVTTDRVTPPDRAARRSIVYVTEDRLAGDVRYEDLVAAVDVVLTKPGYGIIAECIAGETALVYTSRGRFREYPVLVEAMPRYLRTRFLAQADLFAGRWREALEGVIRDPAPPERLALDGAARAASILADCVASTSG